MSIRVLVVDDSSFFRRRIAEILDESPLINVIGRAQNGREAVEMTVRYKPDVITMDYEMPYMDGITAVRNIMEQQPTPILMLSSLTFEGARITLDALNAGAVDYMSKNFDAITKNIGPANDELRAKVISLIDNRVNVRSQPMGAPVRKPPTGSVGRGAARKPETAQVRALRPPQEPLRRAHTAGASAKVAKKNAKIIVLGASTGGPVALQTILRSLPMSFPLPILMVQHMPKTFTSAFAERLNQTCPIQVQEAKSGDMLKGGVAYLAPGGYQMLVERNGGFTLKVVKSDARFPYKPSVDVTFGSVAKAFGEKSISVILTGMGTDGREGARLLKRVGGQVWAQDEASSVIYGMPGAVVQARLSDLSLDLNAIGPTIVAAIM